MDLLLVKKESAKVIIVSGFYFLRHRCAGTINNALEEEGALNKVLTIEAE
jgi:hypothetical protein